MLYSWTRSSIPACLYRLLVVINFSNVIWTPRRWTIKSAFMQKSGNWIPKGIVLFLLFVHVGQFFQSLMWFNRKKTLYIDRFWIFNSTESRLCFNNEQNESICSLSKGLSSMDPAFLKIVLKGLAQSFGNLFENVDSNILDLITSSMKHCPIEVNDDVSIAEAFRFHIYHPWVALERNIFYDLHNHFPLYNLGKSRLQKYLMDWISWKGAKVNHGEAKKSIIQFSFGTDGWITLKKAQ